MSRQNRIRRDGTQRRGRSRRSVVLSALGASASLLAGYTGGTGGSVTPSGATTGSTGGKYGRE
ncbi:hypothetical protein [Halogeometricum limi]|uniref:hypothetical protein n=1 Tax=Halogeometricum limi TaxID=555875 RepID=UPI0011139E32|nr:hypothetical protein [Halogeometricum limi]